MSGEHTLECTCRERGAPSMKTAREIIAPIIEPEKAQHVEAVRRLFNWLVPQELRSLEATHGE